MKTRREKDFISFFDEISGLYFRTGIIENGKDSGRDPFMTSFPELLDVGIMGHCVHGQKGLCLRAVAVSWYRSEYTKRAIRMLVEAGVKTNIHYVLSKNTIEEAVEHLVAHTFPENINAIIFLLHKPVGLGKTENIITTRHELLPDLIRMVDSYESGYKIGFDSCTIPALINGTHNINLVSMDTCEGARWSAYISPDMKMMPCSFDNQDVRWAVDIR